MSKPKHTTCYCQERKEKSHPKRKSKDKTDKPPNEQNQEDRVYVRSQDCGFIEQRPEIPKDEDLSETTVQDMGDTTYLIIFVVDPSSGGNNVMKFQLNGLFHVTLKRFSSFTGEEAISLECFTHRAKMETNGLCTVLAIIPADCMTAAAGVSLTTLSV